MENHSTLLLLCVLTHILISHSLLSPVVLVPGDGGNQLEARLDKPGPEPNDCPTVTSSWYTLWLDVWQLRKGRLACWAENIKLVYNKTSRSSNNVPGVFTRVPGWGETSSVEYLDSSWSAWVLGDVGNYMHTMVEHLVGIGYTRGRDLRAAPFDFRFAPQSQTTFFRRLKTLVEETSASNSGKRVTMVSHSMGGLFSLHFLQRQDQDWLDRYIHRFVPLNTPWTGAVIQLNTMASGFNMDISLIDPIVIREEQRSYETAAYILPLPTTWPDKTQVLVSTPSRNYTVKDYKQFFTDIEFPQGMDMMENIIGLTPLVHPRVPTSCIYSVGVETPSALVYGEGFPDQQPRRVMGEGDGTVTKGSAEHCKQFLTRDEDKVKEFIGINHGQILKDTQVLDFLTTQLNL